MGESRAIVKTAPEDCLEGSVGLELQEKLGLQEEYSPWKRCITALQGCGRNGQVREFLKDSGNTINNQVRNHISPRS